MAPRPSARSVALALLVSVLDERRFLEEALEAEHGLGTLEARDRGFTLLLVRTTLRRLGQIDALIAHCLERPLSASAGSVRQALRLGIAQLLFLSTPAHAAVAESVALVRASGQKGLLNAVLRRIAREGKALAERQDAARLNTPTWLWHSWSKAYGESVARGIAEAHLREAPLDITVKAEPERWAERLDARLLPTGGLRRSGGVPVASLPGYDEGAWWVQDAAAAIPARLFGEVSGQRVIDLCAAPGGKTAQLAAAGARVTALDIDPVRLVRLEVNLTRLGLRAETVCTDGRTWRPPEPADAVLVDAPCSGTGAIRRHPDVQRLKRPADVAAMVNVQAALLAAAVEMIRPGGLVVFATCSLEPEEGPARTAALLASGAPVERAPIAGRELSGLDELITSEGDLRTLPCHLAELGGLDGFYAVRLRRRR